MAVTEARLHQLLSGQSSIARKVFVHVPIQECWSAHDIHGAALAANATAVSAHAIRRALCELRDAGIIREPAGGKFQRDAHILKPKSEQPMPKVAPEIVVPIKKTDVAALDALAGLSAEVVGLAGEISARLKGLSLHIEEVALSVEVERDSNAEALNTLKQFQALLKGIA